MKNREKFTNLCREYSQWYTCSLEDCVRRIMDAHKIWCSLHRNSRKIAKADMEILVQRCMDQIYRQSNWLSDFCGEYESLREKISDIDSFFSNLNKEFPNQCISERLGAWGVILKK